MVVPIERVSRSEKSKKYVGNNLDVSVDTNGSGLQVTGNNCRVQIRENGARIKVIGDNCEITVLNGRGGIEYIGNCGKINLGPRVPEGVLSYIGNKGKISSVASVGLTEFKKSDGQKTDPELAKERVEVKGGFTARTKARISVCDSKVIRIATSCCMPETINICIPRIRISGNRYCHKH